MRFFIAFLALTLAQTAFAGKSKEPKLICPVVQILNEAAESGACNDNQLGGFLNGLSKKFNPFLVSQGYEEVTLVLGNGRRQLRGGDHVEPPLDFGSDERQLGGYYCYIYPSNCPRRRLGTGEEGEDRSLRPDKPMSDEERLFFVMTEMCNDDVLYFAANAPEGTCKHAFDSAACVVMSG